MGRKEPVKEVDSVNFGALGDGLRQVSEANQQQENEGHRSQQRIERQGTSEKWNIIFVGRLQRPANEAGG
jgi:hypothetical protein